MKTRILMTTLAAATLAVWGCRGTVTNSPPSQTTANAPQVGPNSQYSIASAGEFLPVGHPIPVISSIDRGPEPFDPRKGHRLIAATQPAIDPGARTPSVARRVPSRRAAPPSIAPQTPQGGYSLSSSNYKGFYAGNDVQDDISIPTSLDTVLLYAPTHLIYGAAWESTTIHWHQGVGQGTSHHYGLWDWRTGYERRFIVYQEMNAAWKSKYARNFGGESVFFVEVYQDSSSVWHAIIYNFNLGQWEEIMSSGVSGELLNGWTAWESHGIAMETNCPNIPRIRAGGVRVLLNGAWELVTPALSSAFKYGNCFDGASPAYTMHENDPNYNWEGYTP